MLAAAAVLLGLAGCHAASRYERETGERDAGAVVVDEVVGQWLVLATLPLDLLAYALGFAAFRLFDIAKPPPIGWIERRIAGGAGVMADDVAAAACAVALLHLADRGAGTWRSFRMTCWKRREACSTPAAARGSG